MLNITKKWLWNETDCSQQDGTLAASDSLAPESFKGLFIIVGASALSALLIFFCSFLNDNKCILASDVSIWQKLSALAKAFCEGKDTSSESQKPNEGNVVSFEDAMPEHHPPSPETSIADSPGQGVFAQDEGFSTTEPGSPVRDSIPIPEEEVSER
nr:glutamate receptor 2.8-like [Ipomoea batatas]